MISRNRSIADCTINWVYTDDLVGTKAFYAEKIGLKVAYQQEGTFIFHLGRDCFLGICKVRPGRYVEPRGTMNTIVTNEVDDWYEKLIDAGVEIESPPQHNETFGIYHFFAKDPNGYVIEFQRFTDPRWAEMRKQMSNEE